MKDIVAIQQAIFHGLRSCNLFDSFNVVLGRELLAQSEIEMDAIWQTPRNGAQGLGLIVQIPSLIFPGPNSLQRRRLFSVGIYEQRDMNFTPGIGTMTCAEDVGDLVIDFLWNWRLWRASGLIPDTNALVPDTRFPGVVGMLAKVALRQERAQPARAATPVIDAGDPNNVAITVADGSKIYYTTDGFSFPGKDNTGVLTGEQGATLYAAPFAAQSGQIIMAVAYLDGELPSQLVDFQIP
jgi:hypothetical protein